MRTPTKLNKEQKSVLEELEKEYKAFTKADKEWRSRIAKLFYKAGQLKIPTPQVSNKLGITKCAVAQRYEKLPH
jgi:hypothetical protein